MRRRGRGTFGGRSGVWWRRSNRLSMGSATSKGTSETGRLSIDSVDTSSDSVHSPTELAPNADYKDEERFLVEPLPLLQPSFTAVDPSSDENGIPEYNCSEAVAANVCAMLEADSEDELEHVRISSDGSSSGETRENGEDVKDETDKENTGKPSLKSPVWNQSKRQRKFGGKIRWITQANMELQNQSVRELPKVEATKKEHNVNLNQNENRKRRKAKLAVEEIFSPRTQKEIDYYRTRFERLDKEVTIKMECVEPVQKRTRRPPKRLNLL